MTTPSVRAQVITRRTYNRPLNDKGTIFETWEETVARVIDHQMWLWERALNRDLNDEEHSELYDLEKLMQERKVSMSGRCFTGDTRVKLMDGTTPRFDELEVGKEYWAYGCELDGKVVPVKAINNGITRVDKSYAKILLDNNETITCTIDHPFLTREGKYVEAKDLIVGQSLMPLYTRLDKKGYEEVYDNKLHTWTKTHKWSAVNNNLPKPIVTDRQFLVLHHKDFNKLNNTPDNLVYLGDKDHFALHSALGKENVKKMNNMIWHSEEYSEFRKRKAEECMLLGKKVWSAPEYEEFRTKKRKQSSKLTAERNKGEKQRENIKVFRNTEKGTAISLSNLEKANKDNHGIKVKLFNLYKHMLTISPEVTEEIWDSNRSYTGAMRFRSINKFFEDFNSFKEEFKLFNHTIKSIEIIHTDEEINFYDFSVPKTVNFALASGVFVHNTLWLGGTEVAKQREASQFNCSFTEVETVYDLVDILWLLLQGCGVGFKPKVGILNGFSKPIKNIKVIRSTRTSKGGLEHNVETVKEGVWTIKVGDSAEAWARSIGKLIAGKYSVDTLVLDFSELRPAGDRLKGYGWISSGDGAIAEAYVSIANILNDRSDSLLTRMNILDIVNWLGTILSSRRSAQIALFEVDQPEWEEFAVAKKDWWKHGNSQRQQSNNSLLFNKKPSLKELQEVFKLMLDAGGSEPGFINASAARSRAPWFVGCNPCVEILLGNKSFCNLTEVDIGKFKKDRAGLHRALYLAARANYRQTCVNLKDGILQEAWHLNNYFLRLCGVGLTGISKRPDITGYEYEYLKRTATSAAIGMANDLDLPMPKNITCVKPSGTLSKIMDTTEGIHTPLGKFIFNNVQFSKYDPIVDILRKANYKVIEHPNDESGVLITFPVCWEDVPFSTVEGKEVNIDSAIKQLEKYKQIQTNWTQQNTSVTISYSPEEVPEMIKWLLENWDIYVGVSFIYRTDPTKTAKDLGYLYLPQEVVTEETYNEYTNILLKVNLNNTESFEELVMEDCPSGVCPVK